jgi:hypothetical protein
VLAVLLEFLAQEKIIDHDLMFSILLLLEVLQVEVTLVVEVVLEDIWLELKHLYQHQLLIMSLLEEVVLV